MADFEQTARSYLEAWNRRDWTAFRGVLHDQYTYTGGDGQRQEGPEAGLAVGQMFAQGLPDGRIDIQRVHLSGNTAIVEFIGAGTQTGELMGIQPTGRKINLPVCTVLEFRDGKIIVEREYMDLQHLFQQLGVAQTPAAATTA